MANWTAFSNEFPSGFSQIIPDLEDAYANDFGIFEYETFAALDTLAVKSDLESLTSSSAFLIALADWLLTQANLPAVSSWEDFSTQFSTIDREFVDVLVTYYNATSIGDFKEFENEGLAADLVIMGSNTTFFTGLANALQAREDSLSLSEFAETFPSADEAAMNALFDTLVSQDQILNLNGLANLDKGVLVNELSSLTSSHAFIERLGDIFSNEIGTLLNDFPADDELDSLYQKAIINYFDGNDELGAATDALIEALIDAEEISDLRGLDDLHPSVVRARIAAQTNGSRFFHGIAAWLISKAAARADELPATTTTPTTFEVFVQLVNTVSDQPLPNYKVKVDDKRYKYNVTELAYAVTNDQGMLKFTYSADLDHTDAILKADFKVYDLQDSLVTTISDQTYDPDSDTGIDLEVAIAATPESYISVTYLETEVGVSLDTSLKAYLTAQEIDDLEKIRLLGGLARSTDAAVQNNLTEARRLDAHAQFELISSDAALNDLLVDQGYYTLADVAASGRASFISEITDLPGSTFSQYDAVTVWNNARKASAFVTTQVMGYAADVASGAQSRLIGGVDPVLQADLEGKFGAKCDCDACTSGVSPLAYLAALLNYAEKYVTSLTLSAAPGVLQSLFHHPYCELPADCHVATAEVCQVRVAIEVLRQHLNTDAPYARKVPYLEQAYQLLLNQLGTDFEELRTIASNAVGLFDTDKENLAQRLGIDVSKVDELYLETTGTPTLTEEALELLFGLQDTRRHTFSTGIKIGDSSNDLYNWQLHRVRLNRNTDADGFVYLDIDQSAGIVEVYKSSTFTTANLVAKGTVSTATPFTVQLSPQDDAGISGRLELPDSYASTTSISISVIPKMLAWRLANLHALWHTQDWPEHNSYFTSPRTLPIIEPDWMGPEDMRGIKDGAATASNLQPVPFEIWENRRNWLDTTILSAIDALVQTEDLDQVFDLLEDPVSYTWENSTVTTLKPWDFSGGPLTHTSHGQFWDLLRTNLANPALRDTAIGVIENDMHLSMEEFSVASGLQEKYATQPFPAGFSDEEMVDMTQIYTTALKRAFYAAWISEEDNASITLTPDLFWPPAIDPVQGSQDQQPAAEPFGLSAANIPFIDPDLHSVMDLAGPVFGDEAQTKRAARITELETQCNLIYGQHSMGYSAMVSLAYGGALTFPTSPISYTDLAGVLAGLNNPDTGIRAGALDFVNQTMYLTEQEFREMMVPVAREDASQTVTNEEYKALASILTFAWKRKTAYPTWVTEETTAGIDKWWKAYRHRLPAWRASSTDRSTWEAGLKLHSRVPMVEPDIIAPGDIFNPEFNNDPALDNPAYVLWRTRDALLNDATTGWFTVIAADTLTSNIVNVIGSTEAELEELQTLTEDGVDVSRRRAQLNLSTAELAFLVKIIDLNNNATTISASEWESFHSIILQVKKVRTYGVWNSEEHASDIVLGPDMFEIAYTRPQEMGEYLAALYRPWRSNGKARKDWNDRLQSRIDQERSMMAAIHGIADSVESDSLRVLRDLLIMESNATGDTLVEKSRSLSDLLLTDMEIQCCNNTTRVAAAIETLQSMFHGMRTGQLDAHPNLVLDPTHEDFDQDWKWLGSYGTWRGLMFVYLYPENLLLPSLRAHKTSAFGKIVSEVRNNPRLTPSMACHLFKDYESYLLDLHALRLAATTTTTVYYRADKCGSALDAERTVHFHFAVGGESKRIYWSYFEENAASNYSQTFWEPIPDLGMVHHVEGSFVYETKSGDRYLYVFATKKPEGREAPVLIGNRYNLTTHRWQSDLDDFAGKFNNWSWVIGKRKNEKESPVFACMTYPWDAKYDGNNQVDISNLAGTELHNTQIRYNHLDGDGMTWASDEFEVLRLDWIYKFRLVDVVRMDNKATIFIGHYYKDINTEKIGYIIRPDSGSSLPVRYFPDTRHGLTNTTPISELKGRWRLLFNDYMNGSTVSPVADIGELPLATGMGKYVGTLLDTEAAAGDIYTMMYLDKHGDTKVHKFQAVWSGFAYSNVFTQGAIVTDPFNESFVGPCFKHVHGQTSSTPTIFSYQSHTLSRPIVMIRTNPFVMLRLSPHQRTIFPLSQDSSPQSNRSMIVEQMFTDNAMYGWGNSFPASNPNLVYLEEAYYFLPMLLALELQKNKFFIEALDMFRLVYDYTGALGARKIYYGLRKEENLTNLLQNVFDWLDDPENPHTIASQRALSYTRYTIFSVVRCLQDYADQEFTRDTAESVPRAKMLYQSAVDLLKEEFFSGDDPYCDEMLSNIDVFVDDPAWIPVWNRMKKRIAATNNHDLILDLLNGFVGSPGYVGMVGEFPDSALTWEQKMERLEDALQEKLDGRASVPNRLCNIMNDYDVAASGLINVGFGNADTNRMLGLVSSRSQDAFTNTVTSMLKKGDTLQGVAWLNGGSTSGSGAVLPPGGAVSHGAPDEGMMDIVSDNFPINYLYQSGVIDRPFIPFSNYYFCVPRNPAPQMLLMHAELNLYKIRHCRNIAGIKRALDPYAAATDTSSGMPIIGIGGSIAFPGALSAPPTLYRYEVLLGKAKELVNHAQQVEAALLSTLEKRDAQYYNLMKARQDAKISRAGVRLQDLRIREAEGGVSLAALQRERSQVQLDGLQGLIDAGLNGWEQTQIDAIIVSGAARAASSLLQSFARGFEVTSDGAAGAASSFGATVALGSLAMAAYIAKGVSDVVAIGANTTASVASIYAAFERRKQDWQFQQSLATHDLKIGDQQIKLAQDRLRVVGQERHISNMQVDHAEATVDFLINKFTNYELYDWMSRVLEEVYAFFLQQATSMGKMAQQQLAFERQQPPAAAIQDDYWHPAADNVNFDARDENRVDRKGLTGSARLLQDLTRLDLYAFDSKQRKLQLTRTVSLANLAPAEFEQFRKTGKLTFRTPMEMFDRDHPGHYLRMIQSVSTSVIALIPPTEGVKARLATTGISRIVVGGDTFQTAIVPRGSASVALSSGSNDRGMFPMQPQQGEMLNPFEGMGVDAVWEFRMDRAANAFDYSSIGDVLLTIEYTALESETYREQVVQGMNPNREGELAFSFRYNFPDQWYDLHNASLTADPYKVSLELSERDFPVNLSNLKISHMSLLCLAEDGIDLSPVQLDLRKEMSGSSGPVGGIATPNPSGMASTRTVTSVSGGNALYSGNANAWFPMIGDGPEGKWTLDLSGTSTANLNTLFAEEQLKDIVLIVTYQGTEPSRS